MFTHSALKHRDHTILSLDPMYSPLHNKIGKLVSNRSRRYAIVSCLAKSVYLKDYRIFLATRMMRNNSEPISASLLEKMKVLQTHHHVVQRKHLGKELTQSELKYMARYYLTIRQFIQQKGVDLVIVHNDTRWYHAIAILLCKEMNLHYLVTEQGLIRPHTTVIDPYGVNGFSRLAKQDISHLLVEQHNRYKVKANDLKGRHDSLLAMFFFFLFLAIFTVERWSGAKTIIRYMHNSYRLDKYWQRLVYRLNHRPKVSIDKNVRLEKLAQSALFLMQLENDSQLLLHSEFSYNQPLIDRLAEQCGKVGLLLAIKKHPLDFNTYHLPSNAYFIDGHIAQLARKSQCVVSVNSSSVIEVFSTSIPVYLLGRSVYAHRGVAEFCILDDLAKKIKKQEEPMDVSGRGQFLDYLKNSYLLHGAGYQIQTNAVADKLNQLLPEYVTVDYNEVTNTVKARQ